MALGSYGNVMSENITSDYGWTNATAPESCDYITPTVVRLLQGLGARRVMDLGCGNGALCGLLAKAGYEVVGVEHDSQGCALAQRVYSRVRFYNCGVQDDPAVQMPSEAPFDVVVSTEVIEHLYSPHLLPQFVDKCLKPGGHLIVSTPYHGYLKNVLLAVSGKWDSHHTALWHGGHIKFWSRATLTQLLAANGFDVVGFHGVGRAPYLWKSMVVVARRREHASAPLHAVG